MTNMYLSKLLGKKAKKIQFYYFMLYKTNPIVDVASYQTDNSDKT